jgi:acyl carrier protein
VSVHATEIRVALLEALVEPLAAIGMGPQDVPDDLDLLQNGVVDSLGLVGLLAEVEDRFGVELDYDDMPIEDLARVGPLSRHIERQAAGR